MNCTPLEFYTPLCTVYADTSKVTKIPCTGRNGIYFLQKFKIVLLCGLTELKAQISWAEGVSVVFSCIASIWLIAMLNLRGLSDG